MIFGNSSGKWNYCDDFYLLFSPGISFFACCTSPDVEDTIFSLIHDADFNADVSEIKVRNHQKGSREGMLGFLKQALKVSCPFLLLLNHFNS